MASRDMDSMVSPAPSLEQADWATIEQHSEQMWQAIVQGGPDSTGMITVTINGYVVKAQLGTGSRSVRVGARVDVTKRGGRWVVAGDQTWQPPTPVASPGSGSVPTVSGSTTVPSASAPTASGSLPTIQTKSIAVPASGPSSYTQAWGNVVSQALNDLRDEVLNVKNSHLSAHRSLLYDLRDAHNSTASRVNGVRDAASSINNRLANTQAAVNSAGSIVTQTRQATEEMRAALIAERIVKEK